MCAEDATAEEDVSLAKSESYDTSNQRLVYPNAAELFDHLLVIDITGDDPQSHSLRLLQ